MKSDIWIKTFIRSKDKKKHSNEGKKACDHLKLRFVWHRRVSKGRSLFIEIDKKCVVRDERMQNIKSRREITINLFNYFEIRFNLYGNLFFVWCLANADISIQLDKPSMEHLLLDLTRLRNCFHASLVG